MSIASHIAWRYLFAGRRRFAAFITWISVAGLALGVVVLTVVVSVMNGFDHELRSRLLGAIPHLLIRNVEPETGAQRLLQLTQAQSAVRFFEGAGMVTQNGVVNPISFYGLDAAGIDQLTAHGLFAGSELERLAEPGDAQGIVLGAALARHLGLFPGDPVTVILSTPTATGVKPQLHRFRVVGTFEIGAELDATLGFIHLARFSAQEWTAYGKYGWRVDLDNPMLAQRAAQTLMSAYPQARVETWSETYGEFFRAVALEKSLMFLVLLMVVAVASFNIVSGQLMVVSQKQADIAILRTMGAEAGLVRRVFVLQGVFIATIGILGGLVLGVLAAQNVAALVQWLATVTSYQLLEGTYFAELPSEVQLSDLLVIAVMSWTLCVLAAWLPAQRAANLNPVEALH